MTARNLAHRGANRRHDTKRPALAVSPQVTPVIAIAPQVVIWDGLDRPKIPVSLTAVQQASLCRVVWTNPE
jgi:hypothetical protein